MKKVFFILITLLATCKSFAQDVEATLFKILASGIMQTDDFIKTKKNLKDVFIISDPMTDSTYIQFPEKPWSAYVQSFRNYNNEKQIAILNTDSIPIIPLIKNDTIYIIDTLHFFSHGDYIKNGVYYKLLTDVNSGIPLNKQAYLYKIGIRNNELILSLTFPTSDLIYSIHILNRRGIFNLFKTSTLSLTSLRQHMR